MDFEEAGRRLKIAVLLGAVSYGLWWAFSKSMNASTEKIIAQERAEREIPRMHTPDGREITIPERIVAAAKIGYKDPAAELNALRDIVAAPRDADEKAIAEKKIPAVLIRAHSVAGESKDWPSQASLWNEITAGDESGKSRRKISDDRARWLTNALKESDDLSADVLAAAMLKDTANDENRERRALSAWRERQLERWQAGRVAKNTAATAAALTAMGSWNQLDGNFARKVLSASNPAELLTLAKASLKSGSYGEATFLFRAAAESRGSERAQAQRSLDDALLALASDPAQARSIRGTPPAALELLANVRGKRRSEALLRAAAILESWADELLAAKPQACAALYQRALSDLKESAGLDGRPPPATAAKRLAEKSADSHLAASLAKLSTHHESAFTELRPLLRGGDDPVRRERALSAIRDAWRKARDENAFDKLIDLSAFWISEAGAMPFSDPFRAELKTTLVALASPARAQELNKRVFTLTLLADAFPDDPDAREARREAAAKGATLARNTSNRGKPPTPIAASNLAGRTVALVENGTGHHILMLYEGPETFFVRINPYRRGSVVLKDGKYRIGVATVKDEITPYALEAEFASALVRHRFVVAESGQGSRKSYSFGSTSYGSWTVLRAPDDEKYAANPKNGMVRRR